MSDKLKNIYSQWGSKMIPSSGYFAPPGIRLVLPGKTVVAQKTVRKRKPRWIF